MSAIAIEERRKWVGASEVGSVFSVDLKELGQHAYSSRYTLHMLKRGLIEPDSSDNERMFWGRKLEAGIGAGLAEKTGWDVQKFDGYAVHPSVARFGASPDFQVNHPVLGPGVVDTKNVDRLVYRSWEEVEDMDDRVLMLKAGLKPAYQRRDPPLRLQLQVQSQIACTGFAWGGLAMLVGGNQLEIVLYQRSDEAIARIESEIPTFWAEVDAETPPPIDWEADINTVRQLTRNTVPGKTLDIRSDLVALKFAEEYMAASVEEKKAKTAKDAAKLKLLERIGDAEKAWLPRQITVSAGAVAGAHIEYFREPYRNFRCTQKKGA